jgi:hypothetical protein
MLAVLTLVVFGCAFASAQTFGFGVAIGSSGLYCNIEQLSYAGGGLYGGIDNLSVCGDSVNSVIGGFASSVANRGELAHGAGVVYGDSIYAATSGNSQLQWTVFSKLKCNHTNKFGDFTGTDGWVGVANFYGSVAGTNQGPLSCSLPGKNGKAPTKGLNTHQKN